MNTQHTLTISFASAEDLQYFKRFAAKARESSGTVAPLYCGLASSAVRFAQIVDNSAAPDLLAVAEWLADLNDTFMHTGIPGLTEARASARAAVAKAKAKGQQ